MPIFTPWWEKTDAVDVQLSASGTALMETVGEAASSQLQDRPSPPRKPIPAFETLHKGPVSATIPLQLSQIL